MARTIVVPLDGSEPGEAALPWATLLARSQGYSLTLARIVPFPTFAAGEFGGYISPQVYDELLAADRDTAESYLSGVRARLQGEGVSITTVVREGSAAEGIHDIADELGAYAVAMASHGRGGVTRIVLGSVAERLIQQATFPVLLVRTSMARSVPSFSRVLVPLDGSALAERGLDEARAIAPADATIILVRAVEPILEVLGEADAVAVVDEAATREAESAASNYLERIARDVRDSGLRVETVIHRGRPSTETLRASVESNADLIIMTSHGHTGPTRWLMGSVADEVFRNAQRPVLVVSARTLAARAAGVHTVRDLMTRDVEFVREDDSIIAVVRKLLRRRVSGAPVVNAQGDLVGVVSELDLLAWHGRTVEQLAKSEESLDPDEYAQRLESESIGLYISRPAISIDQSDELTAAIRLFMEKRLRRLAVTENGKLVGVISRADVLRGMADQWQSSAGAAVEPDC